ncbi:hypothetical protein RB7716 [Rhodopirellula baltica SH 1]|uniref:Uncharacterized protein n=1 Tax=Rhodopirellula baltica (strain DSM 10527 / NCIMB 13988 / SH1) TaxID=243090 RepID=Q7UN91_RHOBA|nr:hypothetical protein RB7716 [Rhodopirellula baltica SH 1]
MLHPRPRNSTGRIPVHRDQASLIEQLLDSRTDIDLSIIHGSLRFLSWIHDISQTQYDNTTVCSINEAA